MKMSILVLCFILFSGIVYSQNSHSPAITISKKSKSDNYLIKGGVILEELNDGNILFRKVDKSSYILEKFDKSGKKILEGAESKFPKNCEPFSSFDKEDVSLIIFKEAGKKKNKIWIQPLDKKESKYASEPKLLLEYESGAYNDEYYPQLNEENGSFILVYSIPVKGKKKESQKNVSFFDQDLNLIYTKSIEKPKEVKIEYSKFQLIDNKLVIVNACTDINTDDLLLFSSTDKIKFKGMVYSEKGELEKEFQVENSKTAYISSFSFAKAKDNTVKFVTTYTDNEKGIVKGFANFSIDVSSDITPKIKYNEIGIELMQKYSVIRKEYDNIEKSYKSGKNKTNYSFPIRKLITHDDGYYAIIHQWGIFTPSKGRNVIWFRDFFVASFDNNDKLNWIRKAPGYYQSFYNFDFAWHCDVINKELVLTHPFGLAEFYYNPEEKWDPSKLRNGLAAMSDFDRERLYIISQKFDKAGNLSRDILYDIRKLDVKFSDIRKIWTKEKKSMPFVIYKGENFQTVDIDF